MTSSDGIEVSVVGAAGYVGGELLRLLGGHPAVGTLRAFSGSHAGEPFSAAHPALAHRPAGTFETPDLDAAGGADVVFLALPHGRSQETIGPLLERDGPLLIDLAADFRVGDPDLYAAYYGPHACPELCSEFAFGFADVAGASLRGRRRIASPGCFATAALLALYPFASDGGFEGVPVCFGVTGSSGSGATPKRTTHHPVRAHSFFGYSLGGHRHEAEILDRLRTWTGDGDASARLFTHSAPLVRGIHMTMHCRPSEPAPEPLRALRAAYDGRPFVRVLTNPPELAAVVGTNFAHVHAAPREVGREVVVTVAIDNLVKGAAGQAVQSMNLSLGLDETAGLDAPGIYPC